MFKIRWVDIITNEAVLDRDKKIFVKEFNLRHGRLLRDILVSEFGKKGEIFLQTMKDKDC